MGTLSSTVKQDEDIFDILCTAGGVLLHVKCQPQEELPIIISHTTMLLIFKTFLYWKSMPYHSHHIIQAFVAIFPGEYQEKRIK